MDKTIIITIHGIMTNINEPDDWQEKFGKWLHETRSGDIFISDLIHKPFSYGFLTPLRAFISSFLRWLKRPNFTDRWVINKFRNFLQQVKDEHPDAKIHVIAHSFGTYVTHEVLMEKPIFVQSVTMCGAVISSHVSRNYIDDLLNCGQIKACFNWSSHNDIVVRPIALPPFGHLGYWGFLRPGVDIDRVNPQPKPFTNLNIYNHHTEFTHSGYFIPPVFESFLIDIEKANNLL